VQTPNLVVSETPKVGLTFTMTLRGGKLISILKKGYYPLPDCNGIVFLVLL
jgi:hypothetical protein